MKAFIMQMTTDLKLTLKNIFLWITLAFLVVIIVVINFFLPKEDTSPHVTVVHYGLELPNCQEAGSIEELEDMVQQDDQLAGIYNSNGTLVVLSNHLSQKQSAIVLSTMLKPVNSRPVPYSYTSEVQTPPPFNKRMVPMMICLEAVMTGILLAGVLILTEKEYHITRAYRISPAGAVSYVLAKAILFSLAGMVYSVLIAVFTIGLDFHTGPFLLLSFLASALFTLLGMTASVFMQSLSTWLMLMAFLIGTNTIVIFAYILPAISLDFMKILPAYTIIFAYERTLFGSAQIAGAGFEVMAGWVICLFILCVICVRFRLLQPHKGE